MPNVSIAQAIQELRAFPGQETGDLDAFERLVADALALPQDNELDAAIFGIFERYPDEDGYGVYWSIVHGLEARAGYERALVASVRRCPSRFTLAMLNSLANSGAQSCAGVAIMQLLSDAAASNAACQSARESAAYFIKYQRSRAPRQA